MSVMYGVAICPVNRDFSLSTALREICGTRRAAALMYKNFYQIFNVCVKIFSDEKSSLTTSPAL